MKKSILTLLLLFPFLAGCSAIDSLKNDFVNMNHDAVFAKGFFEGAEGDERILGKAVFHLDQYARSIAYVANDLEQISATLHSISTAGNAAKVLTLYRTIMNNL